MVVHFDLLCFLEKSILSLLTQLLFGVARERTNHRSCMIVLAQCPKSQTARHTFLHTIDQCCPGDHYHEPWGTIQKGNKKVFATALEVHYPKALCEAIANAFALKFAQVGCIVSDIHPTNAAAAASTGLQPTKPSLPPLISEFRAKCCLLTSESDVICWPNNPPDVSNAKLLHKITVGGKDSEAVLENVKSACISLNMDVEIPHIGLGSVQFLKVFGFFWEPEEFVNEAIKVTHPLAAEMVVPKILQDVVEFHANVDAFAVAKKRLKFVAKWSSRAKALMDAELTLKSQIDPLIAGVVKNKKILLFEEMLREVEFPDMGVVEEMKAGASLTGDIPITNMLPFKFVPPLLDATSLATQAGLLRDNVHGHAASSGDANLDAEVWQKTMEEVSLAWLRGPLELSEVPVGSPITRRFGLSQKHKVRLIDDYTQSGVNHCVTVHESPSLHTVDIAASLVTLWLRKCKLNQCLAQLQIKTFDLSSAYKQIALNNEGRKFSFIAVWDPKDKRPKYFQSLVLPFGAVRSVHSFLRVARALWWIGVKGCSLMWSSFFDDFLLFSKPELAKSAEQAAISLFKLTGWLFAEEGRKCVPFGAKCEALGVEFDLSGTSKLNACIRNTESRVAELVHDLEAVISSKVLSSKQAQRLRGRMQFADSQIFGRTSKRCLHTLTDFAVGLRRVMQDKDILFLKLFVNLLKQGPPRPIVPGDETNVLVFTDACYEREARTWISGIGGVMVDPLAKFRRFFSFELSDEHRIKLGEASKKQIIFEAETLSAVTAIFLWKDLLSRKRCIVFVDNEGAKFSMLKARSENDVVDKIVEQFANFESKSNLCTWLARVASKSNIADPPSRGDTNELKLSNAKDDSAQINHIVHDICANL